ncbi:MAG: hypothetical protein ACKN9U_06310, partial [Pirellulaceae bacterium]
PYRPDAYAVPDTIDPGFEIAVNVSVVVHDDVATALWPIKATLGFYIGGMGAKTKNFHTVLTSWRFVDPPVQSIRRAPPIGKRQGRPAIDRLQGSIGLLCFVQTCGIYLFNASMHRSLAGSLSGRF